MILTEDQFVLLLRELAASGLVWVTGSFATGRIDDGHFSDIDFKVKDSRAETPRDQEPIVRVMKILDRFGVPYESSFISYIHTPRDLVTLPRPLEFSTLFEHTKGRSKSVEVYGVVFQTW